MAASAERFHESEPWMVRVRRERDRADARLAAALIETTEGSGNAARDDFDSYESDVNVYLATVDRLALPRLRHSHPLRSEFEVAAWRRAAREVRRAAHRVSQAGRGGSTPALEGSLLILRKLLGECRLREERWFEWLNAPSDGGPQPTA
jgi:hypothetical protein